MVLHEEFFWRQAVIIFDWTAEQAIKITKGKNNELFLLASWYSNSINIQPIFLPFRNFRKKME